MKFRFNCLDLDMTIKLTKKQNKILTYFNSIKQESIKKNRKKKCYNVLINLDLYEI